MGSICEVVFGLAVWAARIGATPISLHARIAALRPGARARFHKPNCASTGWLGSTSLIKLTGVGGNDRARSDHVDKTTMV
jgi:hypothetical protein